MSGFAKTCHCGRRALPGTNRCARHPAPVQTQAERLAAQPWREAYSDPSYARNRKIAWERSGHHCEVCGTELDEHSYICDHVIALTDGGTNDHQNFAILCTECSKTKTRRDRRARAKRRQA